jgi:hypothetical protein
MPLRNAEWLTTGEGRRAKGKRGGPGLSARRGEGAKGRNQRGPARGGQCGRWGAEPFLTEAPPGQFPHHRGAPRRRRTR